MPLGEIANLIVVVLAIAAGIAFILRASVRFVGADERVVVFRLGRPDTSGPRGPGLVLLAPIIDRTMAVDLRPQRHQLDDLPITTGDGNDVSIDVNLEFRVVRPDAFAVHVVSPPSAGARLLVRDVLTKLAGTMTLGDVLTAGVLQADITPVLQDRLTLAGATDVVVRVLRVRRSTPVPGAEEARLARLGATRFVPGPDTPTSKTIAGDLRWALGKVGRMIRWQLPVAVVIVLGWQVLAVAGLRPWSPIALLTALLAGGIVVPLAEVRSELRRTLRLAGRRRTVLWLLLLLAWSAATLGAVFGLIVAAGNDRLAS